MKPKNGDFLPGKQKKRKREIVEKKYNIDSSKKQTNKQKKTAQKNAGKKYEMG